jgi:two-component system, chemotaxis family, protein-glutamate methylesterase/glutaminase
MPIKVLIVDDSFFMRKLLGDMLSSDDIEVAGVAKSGSEAIKKIPQIQPDVITLDLVMPGWDGLTTLKHIMEKFPTPVIILSAHSSEGADITMECMAAGAVGFVLKPSGELSLDIDTVAPQLIKVVRAASKVDVGKIRTLLATVHQEKHKTAETGSIIVIGASTGGPQTLAALLSSLSYEFSPPIIIVQHMPSIEFTHSLVKSLKRVCQLEIKVAEDHETIAHKKVYLVPGGYSMTLQTMGLENRPDAVMRLVKDMPDALTPSIDTTMKSIAGIYKGSAIGIILTGMGSDGAEGMEAIKKSGGATLAQDDTALIFGMPREVIERGCADSVLPVDKIAGRMAELVCGA